MKIKVIFEIDYDEPEREKDYMELKQTLEEWALNVIIPHTGNIWITQTEIDIQSDYKE